MSEFKVGWYSVHRSVDGTRRCLYFRSRQNYTAQCTIDSNGRQFLTWQDPAGPSGVGLAHLWSPAYEFLPNAPAGDGWDNASTDAKYKPENPGNFSRIARKPTARELSQRACAADASQMNGLSCIKEIHVGIFFDGTNNNMDRDRPEKGHSNVVSLWDAHREDKIDFFRYYIPGVGTRFAEIGEEAESNSDGNTFAAGGEARIHFGMLQVFNAVCTAATGYDLLTRTELKSLVTSTVNGLHTVWRLGDSKMVTIFRDLDARLCKAVEGKRPKVIKVNVSVIGFSRGAAEARVFAQWLQRATGGNIGGAMCNMRFLGLFDTVASVAIADSAPVGRGLMDWADGNLSVSGMERTAHFVAAHEIRRSFPLSTARTGGIWPVGVREYVYPGAHSDVGGGYSPGNQGKAMAGRSSLLAQIPLNDMYHEALNAAVKVLLKPELEAEVRADFTIDSTLDQAFSNYAGWAAEYTTKQNVASGGARLESRMHYHTCLYWRWRAHVSSNAKFMSLSSYNHASAQDKVDLWEAELDWRRDVASARQAATPSYDYLPTMYGAVRSATPRGHASEVQQALLREVTAAADLPDSVSNFFDSYVHDSHAGFWMLGPRTKLDKKALLTEIKSRQATRESLLKMAAAEFDPQRALFFHTEAGYFELNQFERRVLSTDAASPGSIPVLTDADAPALRALAGTATGAVLALMGTATRREAAGHGHYRRIFDQS